MFSFLISFQATFEAGNGPTPTLRAFSNLTQRRQSILSFLLTLTVCGAFYIKEWARCQYQEDLDAESSYRHMFCVFGLHAKGCTCPQCQDLPYARVFLQMYKLQNEHSIMLTAFVRKILVLGTNQTKMAVQCLITAIQAIHKILFGVTTSRLLRLLYIVVTICLLIG